MTFTDDIGNAESLISEGTAEVTWRPGNPATGAPTIGGTPEVFQALTAHTSSIGDEDGLDNVSFEYQWVAIHGGGETDIPGATKANYTLVLQRRLPRNRVEVYSYSYGPFFVEGLRQSINSLKIRCTSFLPR